MFLKLKSGPEHSGCQPTDLVAFMLPTKIPDRYRQRKLWLPHSVYFRKLD